MVVEDCFGHFRIEAIACHCEAELGVASHQLELFVVEGPRLAEYRRVEMDLADVVEDARECEAVEVFFVEAETGPEVDREVSNAVDMAVEVLDDVFHDLDQYVSGDLPHSSSIDSSGDIQLVVHARVLT